MITTKQQPRHNPTHGAYVRVAVADLEVGNRYIFGVEPVARTVDTVDYPLDRYLNVPRQSPPETRPGYRWVNGEQRQRRSWRDVLVSSLTDAQRADIVDSEPVR